MRTIRRLRAARQPATELTTLLVFLVVAPALIVTAHGRLVMVLIVMYASLAISWNLTLGLAGIFNFAQIGFFGIGAYTAGILVTKTSISPWLTIPLAGAAAAVASLVAFLPVIRLRGIYVGLATYVFSQLCVYLVLGQSSLTGGANGIIGIPYLTLGGTPLYRNNRLGFYVLGAAILFLVVLSATALLRSTYGRSLIAIRDNEQLALSRGVSRVRQHVIVFAFGAAIAGVVGSFDVYLNGVVSTDIFGFGYLTLLLSMIFVGGSGTLYGPIVGAVIVTVVSDHLQQDGPWRNVVIAAIILAVLLFLPKGLVGALRDASAYLRRAKRMPRSRQVDAAPDAVMDTIDNSEKRIDVT